MKLTPRPYQTRAARAAWRALFNMEAWSALVVMFTSAGKTVLFWMFIRAWHERNPDRRVMLIAHREELLTQAQDKGRRLVGIESEIEMADQRAETGRSFMSKAPVIAASVQTLWSSRKCKPCWEPVIREFEQWKNDNPDAEEDEWVGPEMHGCDQCVKGKVYHRLERFRDEDIGLVVIDECHRATSKEFRAVINQLRSWNPDLRLLGVTATPDRSDEVRLLGDDSVFEELAFEYDIKQGIADGWCVPIRQLSVEIEGFDLSHCGKKGKDDLADKDVAAAVSQLKEAGKLPLAIQPIFDIAEDKRVLMFVPLVENAKDAADECNSYKAGSARVVHGGTPKDLRREMIKGFANDEFQVFTNVGVFTEGFDDPGVHVIAMLRPTGSRAFYTQAIGRALRVLPGTLDGLEDATPEERKAAIAASDKPYCTVIDFVGNSGRHKLINSLDILAGNAPQDVIERARILINNNDDGDENVPVDPEEMIEKARKQLEEEEEARKKARALKPVAKVKYKTRSVDPFDVLDMVPQGERGWHSGKSLTFKQKKILMDRGVCKDEAEIAEMGYGRAKALLDELFRRQDAGECTYKQAKHLKKHGLDPRMSFDQAKKELDRIFRK